MHVNPDSVNLRLAHARLVEQGLLRPVKETTAEGTRFKDCDLACILENRLDETVDGMKLTPALRRAAEEGLGPEEKLFMPHETPAVGTAFWIMDGKDVAGTVLFSHRLIGIPWMLVSSLYVRPRFRGRGLSSRVLQQAYAQAVDVGATGLQIGTQWTWGKAIRFYLKLGCWVCNWRRDVSFLMDSTLPRYRVDILEDTARFIAVMPGREQPMFTARNLGGRLGWEQHVPQLHALEWDGMMTFGMHLASRGWPLIRSTQLWEAQVRAGTSEGGPPEGLAWKIAWFEAWEHKQGFKVDAPRIPGLEYPTPQALFG